MGKYASGLADLKKREGEVNIEIIKTRMLQAIANELAEQNRLKRLELNFLFLREEIITTPINSEKFGKEISEDQAL